MKRIVSIVLMICAITSAAGAFSDISGAEYYAEAVNYLKQDGIFVGYLDGTFGAERGITRAEVVAMQIRALGLDDAAKSKEKVAHYADVPLEHWANGYIMLATEMKIITGDGDGNFRPEGKVQIEEAIKIVVIAAGFERDGMDSGGWPYGYMAVALDKGMLDTLPGSVIEDFNRGAVAELMYRGIVAARNSVKPKWTAESEHFVIALSDEHVKKITPENLNRWLKHLDEIYDVYGELVGTLPVGGEKIIITEKKTEKNVWAWVYEGGGHVFWNPEYIAEALTSINDNDDWCFGIIHEIGHIFDLDGRWNFDAEAWANIKTAYALEMTDGKFYIDGNEHASGQDVKERYLHAWYFEPSSSDALVYEILDIKDKLGGWDAFKDTFRDFDNYGALGSEQDKFDLFIQRLSENSGYNVLQMISPRERENIRSFFDNSVN